MTGLKIAIVVPAARPRNGRALTTPGGAFSLMAMAQAIGKVAGMPISVGVHHEEVSGRYEVSADQPDILMLSYLTLGAQRAYEISGEALRCLGINSRPISVVHGGFHATCLSEEASRSAHIVVRGEVTPNFLELILEEAWTIDRNQRIITRLPEVPKACIERTPIDWRKVDTNPYHLIGMLTSSGCPFGCSFCVAPKIYGAKARFVPLSVIEAELATIPKRKLIAIIDDNFLQSPSSEAIERCLAVARLIHASDHRWVAELTTRTLDAAERHRPGFIRQLARLGCIGLYFGLESVGNDADLKKIDDPGRVLCLLRTCQARGLMVLGAFVLGLSGNETVKQVRTTIGFAVKRARLDYAQFAIKFPPPGSLDWTRALKDRTLTSLHWPRYGGTHSVVRHPKLSAGELEQMLHEAYRRFYNTWSIIWRLFHPINFIHPLAWLRRVKISLVFNAILWRHSRSWHPEAQLPDEPVPESTLEKLAGYAPFEIGKPDGISVVLQRR